jgi:two-component system alkaline phosphatase synthesis response regulator PhoP
MSRVLVIDDETVIGTILRYAFDVDGHQTLVAGDGSTGIEMARSEHPDVIVLDLMMQDVSGYDVLEVLREEEGTKDLPIVILTAVTMQRERDRCLAKGADVVLIKPFDPREVAEAVVALLPPAASTA